MDWKRTAAKDVFLSYEFSLVKFRDLCEEAVHAKKCVWSVSGTPTTVKAIAVPVISGQAVSRAGFSSIPHDSDVNCR